jgi:hypothetical protein
MKTLRKYSVVLVTFIVLVVACTKDNGVIPFVPVNFTINIHNPSYIDLNAVSGWTYVSGGSRGILVYRKSLDEFLTFDRHSTYDSQAGCQVALDSTNLILVDDCSGSKFLITDGSVLNGPASIPLWQYNNTFDGTFLSVYN